MIARAASAVLTVALMCIALGLQGCGSSTSKPDTTGTTTSTTTTTIKPGPPAPPPSPPEPPSPAPDEPLSVEATVKFLNEAYVGFDENNPKSPLGVTMTMTSWPNTFFGNIYCSTFDNPHNKTGCHAGFADCRLSAALYNHKMIISSWDKSIVLSLQKTTGYILNQTRVEKYLSKCSYMWDGASQNRLNRGCGAVPTSGALDCNSPTCAFNNYCPSINTTCNLNAKEVQDTLCKQYGGPLDIPKYGPQSPACIFPGPSIDLREQGQYHPRPSYLRDMANARAQIIFQFDAWNEVVIDEKLMLEEISRSPTDAVQIITAFVYTKKGLPQSKQSAEKMRDEYCKFYKIKPIPLVEIDDTVYQPNGPFMVPNNTESTTTTTSGSIVLV